MLVPSVQEKREESEVLVQVKGRRDEEDTLSSCHSSQADWIRQYRTRLEEVLINTCNHFSQEQKQNNNYIFELKFSGRNGIFGR